MSGFDTIIVGAWWNLEVKICRDAGLHRVSNGTGIRKVKPDLTLIFPFGSVGCVVDLKNECRAGRDISGNAVLEFHGGRARHISTHRLKPNSSLLQDRVPTRWIDKDNDV